MKNLFWNILIKVGGVLAGTGWTVSRAGDSLMEAGRVVGFGALDRLGKCEGCR